MIIRVFLFIVLVTGLLAAVVAYRKGRDWFAWMLASMIFAPLLLFLLILPSIANRGGSTRCPKCSSSMDREDAFCRRCGYQVPIEMRECPSCGKYVRNTKYCSDCGKTL